MAVKGTLVSTKPDLVLWTGPVWAGNLSKVEWAHDTQIVALSCEGSENCASLGYNLPATGKLQALIKQRTGRLESDYDKIMLGSFSAGHGLTNLILNDAESRTRLAAVGAFDSYYTGPAPALKQGYLAFARMAAEGGHLFWTSCSGIPDRKWLSCEDSIKPLLDAIQPEEDSLPEELDTHLKTPAYFVRKYGFTHAFYDRLYTHAEHATVVAPAVFQYWLSPLAHGEPPASWVLKGGVVLGTVAAALGAWKFGRWLRGRR